MSRTSIVLGSNCSVASVMELSHTHSQNPRQDELLTSSKNRDRALHQVYMWSFDSMRGDYKYRQCRLLRTLGSTCKAAREIIKPFVENELECVERERQAKHNAMTARWEAAANRMAKEDVERSGESELFETLVEFYMESFWNGDNIHMDGF